MAWLSDDERRAAIRCLEKDEPLPDWLRARLLDNNKEAELLWRGKTKETCREIPPFQTVLRQPPPSSSKTAPESPGWRNKLILGDNRLALSSLIGGPLRKEIEARGGLKLIYIDPPYNSGLDFYYESGGLARSAFNDSWSVSSFLNMIYERLILMRGLLSDDGCVYVHCDWRTSPYMRLMLDEVFGFFQNEICWHYTGGGRSSKRFSRKHDSIFIYSKSDKLLLNADAIRIPYKKSSGYAKSGITSKAGKKYLPNPAGSIPDDVWEMPIINPLSHERAGYPTQKPEALLKRIIQASSNPGDLIADFFCGSGTLACVAEKLGHAWIACDASLPAIQCARKRLIKTQAELCRADLPCQPFDLLSIGAAAPCRHVKDNINGSNAKLGKEPSFSGLITDFEARPLLKGGTLALEITWFKASRNESARGGPPVSAGQAEFIVENNRLIKIDTKKNGNIKRSVLTEKWEDWIDLWELDFNYGFKKESAALRDERTGAWTDKAVFSSDWQSFRSRGEPEIKLTSPFREITGIGPKIAVRVTDITGGETMRAYNLQELINSASQSAPE